MASAVPQFAHVLKISHAVGTVLPVIACTWIPVIIIPALLEFILLLLKVTVIVDVVTARPPKVILEPVTIALQEAVLNLRLFGAVKIRVTFV